MREFITEDEVERAIHYLAGSVENYAKWKSRMKYLDKHRKSVRAMCILRQKGKTISENTIRGEAAQEYQDVLAEYEEAVREYTLIEAYRNAAEVKVEVWRTITASNRRGNI